jgi:hypothetical protein
MGRWGEYRERQEQSARQQELHDGKAGGRAANLSEAERRQMGFDYAQCIADKHPALVKEYVLSTDTAVQRDDKFRILSDFDCVPNHFKNQLARLRLASDGTLYSLSEAQLRREKLPLPTDFAAIPFLKHLEPMKMENYKSSGRLSKKEYAERVERSLHNLTMARIGECTVRGDVVNADALLATPIASEAEKAALQALVPAVSKCIENGSIKLLPEQLRGSVAYNLYRLSHAAVELSKDTP